MRKEGVRVLLAVNQVERHLWQQQRDISEYCAGRSLVVVAHSPLTQGRRLGDPVVKEVAAESGQDSGAARVHRLVQKGVVIILKSDREARIMENMEWEGWELGPKDMQALDGLDEGQRANAGEWDPFGWE